MPARNSRPVARRLDGLRVANTLVRYQPGETVFAQGDRSADVMYIQQGRVKLTARSPTGRIAVVAILHAGSFFGEGALAGQRRRHCNAETLMTSTIALVKTADMRRGLSEKTTLADCFLSHLLDRNIRTESDLIDQLFSRGEKQLARVLLLLANFDTHYLPHAPLPIISRNLLADMAGTTRSNVDVLMNKFRKRGFIDRLDGGIRVNRSLLTLLMEE